MNLTAYGIEVVCAEKLPLESFSGKSSEGCIELAFSVGNSTSRLLSCDHVSPAVEIHGRAVRLSSNFSLDSRDRSSDRCWTLSIGGVFDVLWCNTYREILVCSDEYPDLELVAFWLLHTILPVYSMLRGGGVFLHAASVAIDGDAVVFLAPSMGGKSTIASYFTDRGHQLLSDDKLRVSRDNGGFQVFPSHPYVRVSRELESLGRYCNSHAVDPVPLGCMIFLEFVEEGAGVELTEISGLEKFELLMASVLYEPVSLPVVEIQEVLALAQRHRLYRMTVPRKIERLPEVYRSVVAMLVA